jgi:hypothetical protein
VQPNTLDLLGFALLHPTYQIHPTTTSSNTIAMKLIQVSPRQLICEDDMHRQYMTAWFQVSIGFSIFGILARLMYAFEVWASVTESGNDVVWALLVLYLGFSSIYIFNPHYTAMIDLDRECIEIKEYWPLFRKRRIRQYPIGMIARIEVKPIGDDYQVVWRQYDDALVMFGIRYTEDRSRAEADAEIIRSFLNQDGRDIEITS